ncbi:MAG: diguanylate cyclase, partial [gamma proteobacterium symbiont of Lucinoma myriamae]|nr:diguanylate cyclase [gamma proteobacterium symbiont of Lucinoma myriamae]MCU7833520.1 diguanylate cyclase [gamma proteobacterium symbiont of Lucinoma myriamae]
MEDKLTRLYDRETFFKLLAQHIMSVHDHKVKLALLVIDINRFDRINKLYDYPDGDLVLKQFAKLLNRVATGFSPTAPTPPIMRVRNGRFTNRNE